MDNKPFLKEAEAFAAEMAELIKVYEDGDEPDERYKEFVKEFSKKIIGETSLHMSLDLFRELKSALQLISKIKNYHGEPFEGSIDSYLNSAILHVMKPVRALSSLIEDGSDENSEIVVNGVKMTISQALFIYEHIDAIAAGISNSLFYKGVVNTDDIASENLGYNPIQKPKEL